MYSYKYWLQQKRKAAMKLNARYCTTMCYKTGKLASRPPNTSLTSVYTKYQHKQLNKAIYVLFSIL